MLFSFALARIWGIVLFLICFSLLLNHKRFIAAIKKIDTVSMYIIGLNLLVIGSIQVVGYEHWTFDWTGLLTLLGWLTLLKGLAFLFIPGYSEKVLNFVLKENWYSAAVSIGMLL